jgi:serine/arginine repetitive matrix protein 2
MKMNGLDCKLEPSPNSKVDTVIPSNEVSPLSQLGSKDRFDQMFGLESSNASKEAHLEKHHEHIDLQGCRHVDVKTSDEFNVHHTCRRQPVARDWTTSRKRFAATIACINTALIGIVVGIYAGEVPAIQYVVVDLNHYTILGNVVLYLGLAIPTLLLWPLPLLHGRKPYIVMALAVALCLQIPQGVAVSAFRSPYVDAYRKILLLSRAASGFVLGFVNINLQATLLDLFGASLQSGNPHQEIVDPFDVRRHGGGMGLWLGVWSWCSVGSISVGFFIGTLIIDGTDVSWGFWTSLLLMMVVLLLNVIGPEVRRSAYRRTVEQVLGDQGYVSRVSRGEVKMHLHSAGPYWWGEEVKAGMEMCWSMMKQPGFAVLAIYTAWTYAHFTLVLMVCGSQTQWFWS